MHNCYLMTQLAEQHARELRGRAARIRAGRGTLRLRQPSRARRQAGWALVTLGLRLAVGRPAGAL
jgi:hypothetical protein